MKNNRTTSHRHLMTIYFRSRGRRVSLVFRLKRENPIKWSFLLSGYPKIVESWVNFADTYFKYDHQHLFHKSTQTGQFIFQAKNGKIRKMKFSLVMITQNRSQWSKLRRFLFYILLTIQQYNTDAPWPFISEIEANGTVQFSGDNWIKIPNKRSFFCRDTPKSFPME